ncbi:MAG: ribonuclease E/G, partial [Pseudomonadota bacterium]
DLAGLIVIDFIDMDDNGNIQQVEHAMRDALKQDRARIQIGRISSFGLMEMSRQRMRPSLIEATSRPCEHCHGTGRIKSVEAAGLSALRALEEIANHQNNSRYDLTLPLGPILFIINNKRETLQRIETTGNCHIHMQTDTALAPHEFVIALEDGTILHPASTTKREADNGSAGSNKHNNQTRTTKRKTQPQKTDQKAKKTLPETRTQEEDTTSPNRKRTRRGSRGRGRNNRARNAHQTDQSLEIQAPASAGNLNITPQEITQSDEPKRRQRPKKAPAAPPASPDENTDTAQKPNGSVRDPKKTAKTTEKVSPLEDAKGETTKKADTKRARPKKAAAKKKSPKKAASKKTAGKSAVAKKAATNAPASAAQAPVPNQDAPKRKGWWSL